MQWRLEYMHLWYTGSHTHSFVEKTAAFRMEMWKRHLSHDAELNEVVSGSVIWNSAVERMEWNDFKS